MLYEECNKSYEKLQEEYSNISNRDDITELVNKCKEKFNEINNKSMSDIEYLTSQIKELQSVLSEMNLENEKLEKQLKEAKIEGKKIKKEKNNINDDINEAKKKR